MKNLERFGIQKSAANTIELSRDDVESLFANAMALAKHQARTLLAFGSPDLSPDSKNQILAKINAVPFDLRINQVLLPDIHNDWPKPELIRSWVTLDINHAVGELIDEFAVAEKDQKQQLGLLAFAEALSALFVGNVKNKQ